MEDKMEGEKLEKRLIEKPESPLRDERGRFLRSGNPMGKPKGAISKFTQLREDFFEAYQQMGGVQGLLTWAKEHPSEFYPMIFKLLPKEIPPLDQESLVSYEERLRLFVHESTTEEESETAYEDVRELGSRADDEKENNEEGGTG